MLTFYKGHYTKRDIHILKRALLEAQYYIEDSYAECTLQVTSDADCSNCAYREPCKDLQRIIRHLDAVEKSVETVNN